MSRARASVGADAIRIEDEVWQEAFSETTRPRSRPRLRSLDGVDPGPPRFRPAARRSARASEAGQAAEAQPAVPDWAGDSRPKDGPPAADWVGRSSPEDAFRPASSGDQSHPEGELPVRRTVTITGRGAERNLPWPTENGRRRAARRAHERASFKPDRVAMWAVLLGMLLLFVAAASAHA
jgi:hypothetical protein